MSEFVFCFFFARGIEDSHVLNRGLVLKSEIALNICTTALQDTQENQDYANWNGAHPSLGSLVKARLCRIHAQCPQSHPSTHPSHYPLCVRTSVSGIQGNVNFLFIWEIVHGKQILFSLIHLLIVYNICISMQNT